MLWLRVVHIVAGVFWVGSTLFLAAFLVPAARAAGPEGGRFLERVMRQRRTGVALGVAMLLTVGSGFVMYGRLASGLGKAWATSHVGLALGAGALAAILAVVVGVAVNGPTGATLAALRQRVESGGAPPADATRIAQLARRIELGTRSAALLLAFAAAAMAAARYL